MSLFALILLSISLSVDCFAICLVFGIQRYSWKKSLKDGQQDPFPSVGRICLQTALIFALFHILMIVAGWFLGRLVLPIISFYDHWVAFALLTAIGLKTIIDGFSKKDNELKVHSLFHIGSLLLSALAVSIDAFAVGISFKMLELPLTTVCLCVGITVFLLSCTGILTGYFLHKQMQKISISTFNLIGGLVLIGIGIRILVAHLA